MSSLPHPKSLAGYQTWCNAMSSKPIILYIDDERENLNAFKAAFRFDYQIYLCQSADEALILLQQQVVHIILTDQRMPSTTGVQFLAQIRQIYPNPIRMIITGYSDIDTIIEAINNGQVYRYITKPWNTQELKMTIDGAVQLYKTQQQNKQLLANQQQMLEFVHAASHDLREPVRTIGSYLQLLQLRYNNRLDETANEYIDFALDASQRMYSMIQEILGNRANTQQQVVLQEVNTQQVLQEALQNMDLYIQENEAVINIAPLPTLRTNRIGILRVFQNLISNGIKYCDKKAAINVGATKNGSYYTFSVQDNGIGMADTSKIFTIFERLHKSEKRYEGKGIGLSVCKKIVQGLGGNIWVKSSLGQGSTFYFTLPIQ